jgi:hypothetical protein
VVFYEYTSIQRKKVGGLNISNLVEQKNLQAKQKHHNSKTNAHFRFHVNSKANVSNPGTRQEKNTKKEKKKLKAK